MLVCIVVSLLALACSPEGLELAVDLRTDVVPGVEFTGVRTTIDEETIDHVVVAGEDYVTGERIAEVTDLTAGNHRVTVSLLAADGRVLVDRVVDLDLRESFGLTVVVTRSCLTIVCPPSGGDAAATTCFGGRCVDPRCGADDAACPPPECTSAADCTADVACARAACDEGACLSVADDSACAAGEYCDPVRDCQPEAMSDAGPMDAGPRDSAIDGRVSATPGCDMEWESYSGYFGCVETPGSCEFRAMLGGDGCNGVCASVGETCITSYETPDDMPPGVCERGPVRTCAMARPEVVICVCTRS